MDHWCRVNELNTLPYEQQKYLAIPKDVGETNSEGTVHAEEQYSKCSMYAVNWTIVDERQLETWWNDSKHLLPVCNDTRRYDVVPCSSWVYDQSQYTSTIVSRASMKL